jgi:hypothetical protein
MSDLAFIRVVNGTRKKAHRNGMFWNVIVAPTSQLPSIPDEIHRIVGSKVKMSDEIEADGPVTKVGQPFKDHHGNELVYLYLDASAPIPKGEPEKKVGPAGKLNLANFPKPAEVKDEAPFKFGSNRQSREKVLAFLKDQCWKKWSAPEIREKCGFPKNRHATLLSILNRLSMTGKIRLEPISKKSNVYWFEHGENDPEVAVPSDSSSEVQEVEAIKESLKVPHNAAPSPSPEVVEAVVKINGMMIQAVEELKKKMDILYPRVQELEKTKDQPAGPVTVEIKKEGKPVKVLKDKILPKNYKRVLDLAMARRNILLTGSPGCGKTYLARLVADSLDLEFGGISCTSEMSKSELVGRMVPNMAKGTDVYQSTDFVKLYKNGGLFLLDELDAADANVLLTLNTALANGYINLPIGRAEMHEDFVLIATANTFGVGNSRTFAGRNQLDGATLDRFHIGTVLCDYDRDVERSLCPNPKALDVFWKIRDGINKASMKRVISTRFIQDSYKMMSVCEWTVSQCLTGFFESWSQAEVQKLAVTINDFDTVREIKSSVSFPVSIS